MNVNQLSEKVRHKRITEKTKPIDLFDCYQYGKHLDHSNGKRGYVIVKYKGIVTVFTWNNN